MPPIPSTHQPTFKACPQCGTSVRFKLDTVSGRQSCPHCGYELPEQIGHFKILGIIGTGGMGAVYQGLDTSLERNVAIKIIREEFARNPQAVESFLREARAAAALNHPNIAQIYSFGEHANRYYLVMEYLPHGSLDDRIEREQRLPELEVLDVGIQIASGLQAAHERGLIHRDIKPGNILFTLDGTAKVVDFGLARLEKRTANLQEEGIWGTPYYIAPEKVAESREDCRSDIYSLGGTLFHALAGRAPFEAGSSVEVVEKHLHSAGVSLRTFAPDITPQTVEVIGRMLKRNPDDRPQSYEELLNDLSYAKRFALEKRSVLPIEVESEFTPGMVMTTVLVLLFCLATGWYLYVNRDRYFGSDDVVATPIVNHGSGTTTQSGTTTSGSQTATTSNPKIDYAAKIDQAYEDIPNLNFNTLKDLKTRLESLNIPGDQPAHDWKEIHLGRLELIEGKVKEANERLEKIRKGYSKEDLNGNIEERDYARILAAILTGNIPDNRLDRVTEKFPAWLELIAWFDQSVNLVRNTNKDTLAVKRIRQYLNHPVLSREQRWVYHFQTLANDFNREDMLLDKLRNQFGRLKKDATEGKIAEFSATYTANSTRFNWDIHERQLGRLKRDFDSLVSDFRRKEDEQRKKEAQDQKQAQIRQEQKETSLMEPLLAQRVARMQAYQFDELVKTWEALNPDVTSEKNRKMYEYYLAVFRDLEDFKTRLTEDVLTKPYEKTIVTKSNVTMDGRLSKIADDKLYFQVEGGEIACKWGDLPPSVILQMGEYYLDGVAKRPEPNNSELAHRAISLAVFVREYGLSEKKINYYMQLATRSGSDIQDLVKQLFPKAGGN